MSYEIFTLRSYWPYKLGRSALRERLLASKDDLDEGISIPVEVDLLDAVPAIIEPWMDNGTKEAEVAAVNMAADIQEALRVYKVWLSATRRVAVMRAELED